MNIAYNPLKKYNEASWLSPCQHGIFWTRLLDRSQLLSLSLSLSFNLGKIC